MTPMTLDNTLLLVIDIQEHFIPVMPNAKDFLTNVHFLLKALSPLPLETVVTEQYPKGLGKTIEELQPYLKDAPVYSKTSFSACIPEVRAHLTDSIKHIAIVGMETPICVEQTVHQLLADYPKIQVHLIRDAITGRDLQDHEWALQQLQREGASIISIETFLYRLLGDAKSPYFKTIANLVKNRHHSL